MPEWKGCHKNCPDRAIGCHSTCETYKAYREQLNKENRAKWAENNANAYFELKKSKYKEYLARRKRYDE